MSGGSYNYLCHKDVEDFFGYGPGLGDLETMRDRLAALPTAQDAAQETERLIAVVRQATVRVEVAIERLRPVWKAVEWRDSGDWGDDQIAAALAEYRGEPAVLDDGAVESHVDDLGDGPLARRIRDDPKLAREFERWKRDPRPSDS